MGTVRLERTFGATQRAVIKGLVAYNQSQVGKQPWKKLAVSIRNDDDDIIGGVCGEVWGNYLFVSLVWLDDRHRGQDLASAAMDELEAAAKARGASHAYVDTMSFQARPFYEKRGYRQFGQLDGYFGGHARYWLSKAL